MSQARRLSARLCTIVLIGIVLCSAILVDRARLPSIDPGVVGLQPGDIIFVDIYQGWCHACYWDHMAIYVGEQSGDSGRYSSAVVEATYNVGIARTPVREFLKRDEPAEMAVRRLADMTNRGEVIQKAIDYALAQLGKPFDFTATATVPGKVNEDNLHCAELIWRAFKAGGIELDCNDGMLAYPDDIYYSPRLRPVEPL